MTPAAQLKTCVFKHADTDTHQLGHFKMHGIKHIADLTFQTGFQNYFDSARRNTAYRLCFRAAFGSMNTLDELIHHLVGECLVERDHVFLFHFLCRVCQLQG